MLVLRKLRTDETGSIAIIGAVVFAVLIGAAALVVDLGNWYVTRADLQRTTDLAAIGGAFAYANSLNAQVATNSAADTAEANGAKGGASRNWSASAATLTDNAIIARLVPSPRNASNQAIEVTASATQPMMLGQVITSLTSATISASSWAEITPPTTPSPACVLALAQLGKGVTNDLTIGGNPTLDLNGCTLRSNADIDVFGSAQVTTLGVYAAGSISGSSLITTKPMQGQLFGDAGIVADPYAADAVLQSAFSQLGSGGTSISVKPSGTASLSPGTYSSLDIKGTVSLSPGTYIVNGPVTFDSQATVTGNGVTIIASGAVTINGGASLNLTAPLANASVGVPGIVLASPSTTSATINGGSSSAFEGAIYFPNSNITFTGNSVNGSSGCTQVVAYTITFKGSASLGSSCNNAGVTPINSASSGVTLVE